MDVRSAPAVRPNPHRVSFIAGSVGVAREPVVTLARGEACADHPRDDAPETPTQAQTQALAQTLARSEQSTRVRIADALHDEIGQQLSMALLRLRTVTAQHTDELRDELIGVVSALEAVSRSVRAMTFDLASPVLDQLGLVAAIESLGPQLAGPGEGPRLIVMTSGWVTVDRETTGVLFRIIRELLVNARKHAHASEIIISVHGDADGVRLCVQDDGIGSAIDPSMLEATPQGGYGLSSSMARMRGLGGTLTMCPGRAGGTEVHLYLPHNGARSTAQHDAFPSDGRAR